MSDINRSREIKIEWTEDGFILHGYFSDPKRLAPTLDDVIDILRWYYSDGDERWCLDRAYASHSDKGLFDARHRSPEQPEGMEP